MPVRQNSDGTVTLFRPVGQAELDLISESSFRCFPPRLPSQPIFYPVVSLEYAEQIAREWNTRDSNSGFVGYVTMFRVKAQFLEKFPLRIVGSANHEEFWIPAGELEEFNLNIVGQIEVIREFRLNFPRTPGP